jgi:outer membrane protein OmpA-like peptidoglycan-associated protein
MLGIAVVAVAGLIAVVVLLSHGGGSASKHPAGAPAARRRTAKAGRVHTIRPIATIDDVTSTGDNEDPVSVTVNIYDLRRQGPFVVLDFGLVCPTPGAGCSAPFMFEYSPSQGQNSDASEAEAFTTTLSTGGGISLLDPVGDVEYLSVKNASDDRPDTSAVDQLSDSYVHLEWVKYPAPPAGVQALDVLFPNGGPVVTHIPITDRSSAPTPAEIGPHTQPALHNPYAPPVDASDTAGLTLPTRKLVQTVGNPTGMDTEAPDHSTLSLSSDVLFRFAKSNLTPAAHQVLRNVATRITSSATGTVAVTGYTDSIGTDAVNIPLSEARARSVVNALRPLTSGATVTYKAGGLGSADPVAPNTLPNGRDDPAGRRLNRRVTISYQVRASTRPAPPPSTGVNLSPTEPPGTTLQYTAHQFGGGRPDVYRVTVDRLLRDGNASVLELSMSCLTSTDNQGCNDSDLSGSDTAPPIPFADYGAATGFSPGKELHVIFSASESVSDFYLQDPTTGEIFSPLHDAQFDHPLTAVTPNVWPMGPTYRLWAYFPAAPAGATEMIVWLPGGKQGIRVPLSSP